MHSQEASFFYKQLNLAKYSYRKKNLIQFEQHLKMACEEALWHLGHNIDKNLPIADMEDTIGMLYEVLFEAYNHAPNILRDLLVVYKQESKKAFAIARIDLDQFITSRFERMEFILSARLFPMKNNQLLRHDYSLL